jgi:Scaffold protein Nfu/NifU N terminal
MGQFITVAVQAGASPSVRIFNLNRSITGMAIERYVSVDDVKEGRPPDVLARRLFDLGVESVTVYSNSVTAIAPPERWADLEPNVVETIEHLFGYYGDDAGWAPDALRAIGVEPLPTPEPAA